MDQILEKVKAYAAKAKEESGKIGKQAYDRANSTIASVKLSFAINETEGKIKEVYQALGKIVYDKYCSEGASDETIKEACESLDELYKEKFILKEKKAELKKFVPCTECGEYNKTDAAYCSKCGAKLTVPKTDPDNEVEASEPDMEEDDMMDKIKDTADEMKDKAEGFVDSVKAKIPDEIKDKAEDFKDKAEDFVDSVKAKIPGEIKDKAENIKDKLGDAADVVEEKVRKVIKIKSKKSDEE